MNVTLSFVHQAALLMQAIVATLAMLGLGLEGMSADQDLRLQQRSRPDA